MASRRVTDGRVERHLGPAAVITAIGAATYSDVLRTRPLTGDNLVALSIGSRARLLSLFSGSFVSYLPGYRPLPYVTILAQYRVVGLHAVTYFLLNLLIWAACAIALYGLVYSLTRSRVGGLSAAIFLLLDPRSLSALYLIGERQSTLACLFGIAAFVVAVRAKIQPGAIVFGSIFLLLLSAMLCKEYGLGFTLALAVFAMSQKERSAVLVASIVSAIVVYTLMRLLLAHGATVPNFCEQMGLFERQRLVCSNELSIPDRAVQYGYNVGATTLGTMFPALFNDSGALRSAASIFGDFRHLTQLAVASGVVVAASVAIAKKRRRVVPFITLIAANGVLSFALYRGRNQLVGLIGLYAAAGIGISALAPGIIDRYREGSLLKVSLSVILVGMLLVSHSVAGELHNEMGRLDESPCTSARNDPVNIDFALARELAARYGMDRDC